jgi:hypothetical protein
LVVIAGFGLFGAIFDIGAPSPWQEILDIIVIGSFMFLVLWLVVLIRGPGGPI